MNTLVAFYANESTPDGNEKGFDWIKAAKIIKERKPFIAYAGLREDLEWTIGLIWHNYKVVNNSDAYLASRWATPVLIIDDEEIECYKKISMKDLKKYSRPKWPKDALAIVNTND